MPALQKPRIGARILAAHPLARGLIHDWLMNEGAGQGQSAPFTDYANPRTGGLLGAGSVGTTTGTYWRQGQRGSYIYTDPTGTGTVNSVTMPVGDSSGSGGPPGNVFSFAARVLITSFSAYQSLFGPTAVVASVDIRTNPSAQIEFLKGTVAVIATSTGTLSANTWADIGLSYDGTNAVIYINGIASGSAASAQTFVASQYAIFGGTESPPPAGSAVEWVRMWNRVLAPSEFLDLTAKPFALYQQPRRRRLASSGSTATTLAPSLAALLLTGGTPLITGGTLLSPAATSLLLSGATPTFTAAALLAPSASSLLLTGSAPSVSVLAVLTPSAAALLMSGTTPAIVASAVSSPSAAALHLAGATPVLLGGGLVVPTASGLILTGITPGLIVGGTASVTLTPSAGHFILTGIASPGVSASAPRVGRSSVPTSYTPGDSPNLPGGDQRYLQTELGKISASLATVIRLLPQPSTAAPKGPLDGMQRLARAPWRPIAGVTTDAWVFYDAPSATWLLLHAN